MKLSVVIPFYEDIRFLGEALASLSAQTLEKFQVVLVGDGSPTPVLREVTRLAKKHLRGSIRRDLIAYPDNRGVCFARNYASQFCAKGEFIVVLDADDICMPRRLERLEALLESGCDLVYSDVLAGETPETAQLLEASPPEAITRDQWLFKKFWFNIRHCSAAYRRQLAQMFPYPPYVSGSGGDTVFLVHIGLFSGARLGYVNEPLLFYRRLEGSLSANPEARETILERHALMVELFEYFDALQKLPSEQTAAAGGAG